MCFITLFSPYKNKLLGYSHRSFYTLHIMINVGAISPVKICPVKSLRKCYYATVFRVPSFSDTRSAIAGESGNIRACNLV